jgi:hypothetical protein
MERRTIEPREPSFPGALQAGTNNVSEAAIRNRKKRLKRCIGPELYRVSGFAVYEGVSKLNGCKKFTPS